MTAWLLGWTIGSWLATAVCAAVGINTTPSTAIACVSTALLFGLYAARVTA